MESQAKPEFLLEIGDHYIQANWSHPQSNTTVIAIFRDTTLDNDQEDFMMTQPLRGPWSLHDPINNRTVTDISKAPQAYKDCSEAAMRLFQELNEEGVEQVKAAWEEKSGKVIDI